MPTHEAQSRVPARYTSELAGKEGSSEVPSCPGAVTQAPAQRASAGHSGDDLNAGRLLHSQETATLSADAPLCTVRPRCVALALRSGLSHVVERCVCCWSSHAGVLSVAPGRWAGSHPPYWADGGFQGYWERPGQFFSCCFLDCSERKGHGGSSRSCARAGHHETVSSQPGPLGVWNLPPHERVQLFTKGAFPLRLHPCGSM